MVQVVRQRGGILNETKNTVENVVTAVGQKYAAVQLHPKARLASEILNLSSGQPPAERDDLHRHEMARTEFFDKLAFVRDNDQAPGCARDDLFPQQRAAVSL